MNTYILRPTEYRQLHDVGSMHVPNVYDVKRGCDVVKVAWCRCAAINGFSGEQVHRSIVVQFVEKRPQFELYTSRKIKGSHALLPMCWGIECSFVWLGN